MNMVIQSLPPKHRQALNWFIKNTGAVVSWPDKLADGTLLATKAKGIYKPHWSDYALSIRQNINSPYQDKDIQRISDEKWQYKYCPELEDGKDVLDHYTNRALIKNMDDAVPIGILIQLKPKPNSLYKVLGLGHVKQWDGSFFTIESVIVSG